MFKTIQLAYLIICSFLVIYTESNPVQYGNNFYHKSQSSVPNTASSLNSESLISSKTSSSYPAVNCKIKFFSNPSVLVNSNNPEDNTINNLNLNSFPYFPSVLSSAVVGNVYSGSPFKSNAFSSPFASENVFSVIPTVSPISANIPSAPVFNGVSLPPVPGSNIYNYLLGDGIFQESVSSALSTPSMKQNLSSIIASLAPINIGGKTVASTYTFKPTSQSNDILRSIKANGFVFKRPFLPYPSPYSSNNLYSYYDKDYNSSPYFSLPSFFAPYYQYDSLDMPSAIPDVFHSRPILSDPISGQTH